MELTRKKDRNLKMFFMGAAELISLQLYYFIIWQERKYKRNMIEQEGKYVRHTHSYLSLRKAIGWIGILLPFVLMIGVYLFFKEDLFQSSISHYYYTGMRNVFVGSLCAVALFMFFYSGYDKWDNWAGNIAGFFALGVAFFPTTQYGANDTIGIIHFVCAACFFLTLAVFSIFLFTKRDQKSTPQKIVRNRIHIACGIIMIGCLIAIILYLNIYEKEGADSRFVFWSETIALIAFGISWLTKGGAVYWDR